MKPQTSYLFLIRQEFLGRRDGMQDRLLMPPVLLKVTRKSV